MCTSTLTWLFSNQYHRATAERCARLQRIETGKRAPISTIGRLSFHIVGCRTGHAFDRRSFAVENVDREPCVLQNRLVFLVEPVCRLQSRNRGASLSIQTDPTYVIGPNSGGEMIFGPRESSCRALSCRDFNRFVRPSPRGLPGQFDGLQVFSE